MEQSKVSNALSRVKNAVANPGSYDDYPSTLALVGALAIVVEDLANLRVPAEDQKPEETRADFSLGSVFEILGGYRRPNEHYTGTLLRILDENAKAIIEGDGLRHEDRCLAALYDILKGFTRGGESHVDTLKRITFDRLTAQSEVRILRLEVAKLRTDLAMHVDPKYPAPVLDLTNHVAMVKNLAAVANDAYVNVSNENLNATCEECWEATVRAVLARYDPHGKALVQEDRSESSIASIDCGDIPYTREQLANKLSIAEHELQALREKVVGQKDEIAALHRRRQELEAAYARCKE